jgi:hypothetical protein
MLLQQQTLTADRPGTGEAAVPHSGVLIINADDWGRTTETTDRIYECFSQRAVSSVSAMVFMEDSERASAIARESGVDAGLHLNFTTPFSARQCPTVVADHQTKIARYLRQGRLWQAIFNPLLTRSFQYVVAAQLDEFCRLYGAPPKRLDGHHHMHLCANVLWGELLPPGTVARRNFSFQPGEKSLWNRLYRQMVDHRLARRHRVTDYFFSLEPVEPLSRLQRVFGLASGSVVEVETHPVNADEYRFLVEGEIFRHTGSVQIASRFAVRANGHAMR